MIVKRKMGEPVPDLQQGTCGQFSDAAEISALLHKNCLPESSVSDAGSEAAIQRQLLGNFEDEDEINALLGRNGQDIEPQETDVVFVIDGSGSMEWVPGKDYTYPGRGEQSRWKSP